MMGMKLKEQVKKWTKEQQAKWKNLMEYKVNEQKNIQAQLVSVKIFLQETSKEIKKQYFWRKS